MTVQSETAHQGWLRYRLAVPKPAHAAKLAYIRRLCLSAELMHIETAKLVAELSKEPRDASSATTRKTKRRQ